MPKPPKPWHEQFQAITNNYRFVPFDAEPQRSPFNPAPPATPGAAPAVASPTLSHDTPIPGGLSGIIRMDWIARTPVLFGNQRVMCDPVDNRPYSVAEPQRLYNDPNAPFIIPGRSLRGMIRQVVRIVTKSKAGPVNDQRPARRDPDYQLQRITGGPGSLTAPEPGWLQMVLDAEGEAGWRICKCHSSQIARTTLTLKGKVKADLSGKSLTKLHSVNLQMWKNRRLANAIMKPAEQSWLNVTGYMPPKVNKDKDGNETSREEQKIYETVFEVPDESSAFTVSTLDFRDFLAAYGKAGNKGIVPDGNLETWAREYLRLAGKPLEPKVRKAFHFESDVVQTDYRSDDPPGIPVYYYRLDDGTVVIGMTKIMRFPYTHTTMEAVTAAQPGARATWRDWSEALFGQVVKDGSGTHALKGRVAFGFAKTTVTSADFVPRCDPPATERYLKVTQLQPRPGYFAFYLRKKNLQGAAATYDSGNGMAAGRKYYPAWPNATTGANPWPDTMFALFTLPLAMQKESDTRKPAGTNTLMRFLPGDEATVFHGDIRFHNLLPAELGALLWALSLGDMAAFGGRGNWCHAAGRGRGLSFGSLYPANIKLAVVERNGTAQHELCEDVADTGTGFIEACFGAFGKAIYGDRVQTLDALNHERSLARLRHFCNPARSEVLGLGIVTNFPPETDILFSKRMFGEYRKLRTAIEGGTNSEVNTNLEAPGPFTGNILDLGSDPPSP